MLHPNINSPLFQQITPQECAKLLDCLGAKQEHYAKDEYIFFTGEPATQVGIVTSGSVMILKEDYWGNRVILTKITKGGLFGEAFSCAGVRQLPVSAIAGEATELLLLDFTRLTSPCTAACPFHIRLIQNMLQVLAQKNIMLTQKIEHITKRTIREKLLSYLSAQAQQAGSSSFTIPFNRQELADYLAVDRSALSAELGRLRKENMLEFRKNEFRLL